MAIPQDWRLTNQELYLKEAVLTRCGYAPSTIQNDHDHCEFFGIKFSVNGEMGTLSEGYSTSDRYRWICDQCFSDFASEFRWRVEPNP